MGYRELYKVDMLIHLEPRQMSVQIENGDNVSIITFRKVYMHVHE